MRIVGADIHPRGPAPALGADTAAVLAEIGYDDEEVAALAAAGVVGPGSLGVVPS
jgi:crotonobetainyl-CoA:carnitine CoA-transferase CaiB-like acyl-CoA transferase